MPRVPRKRPSTAAAVAADDAAAASPKRRRGHAKEQPQKPQAAVPLFPLPAGIDAAAAALRHDPGAALRAAYGGMAFPDELLRVFEFCRAAGGDNVATFKTSLADLGLEPCGPFDFLLLLLGSAAKTAGDSDSGFDWLLHCRYAHDSPEFLTLFAGNVDDGGDVTTRCSSSASPSELHLGYVRDSPDLAPACLAMTDSARGGEFTQLGEGICQSLLLYAKRRRAALSEACRGRQDRLLSRLTEFCGVPAAAAVPQKRRDKARGVVAHTLNGLGLSVPVSPDGVGYREVPESDADLRKMLVRVAVACDRVPAGDRQARLVLLEPVDELVTLVHFANDEGDPGMGIELGLGLLSVPSDTGCYDDLIEALLVTGYGLVGRALYADIVRRHVPVRRRYRERRVGGE